MRCGERFEHADRMHGGGRCDPLMRAPMKSGFSLEDSPEDGGKSGIGLMVCARERAHTAGTQLQDLTGARSDEVGNNHETGGIENVDEACEIGGGLDLVRPPGCC